MRYVVYGPGAIGGTIAARLYAAGKDVILIARGGHFCALSANGLEFRDPWGTYRLAIDVVDHPGRINWREDDIVLLAVKTQDTWDALEDLASAARRGPTIVCAQNGVENERLCARLFERVFGMYVVVPALHLEEGVVETYGSPCPGILDVGRYPAGTDGISAAIAVDLSDAGFSCRSIGDIMRWKRAKLLSNLANSIEAAWGTDICEGELYRFAREEGERCLAAAGLSFASETEEAERREGVFSLTNVLGRPIAGGSTWQTVARGQGRTEIDFLNGEIALLGRQHGIPTPVNSALQTVGRDLVAHGDQPGTMPMAMFDELCSLAFDTRRGA